MKQYEKIIMKRNVKRFFTKAIKCVKKPFTKVPTECWQALGIVSIMFLVCISPEILYRLIY